jgi:hypothetical protein
MTNILFLDIDGVLNNTLSEAWFCPYNMQNLKTLIDCWPCKIVLSSDWRRSPKNLAVARSELQHIGLRIFDVTRMSLHLDNRKYEIRDWLSLDKWDKALILDDMEAEHVDPELDNVLFYRTDYKFGLTEEDVDKLCQQLKF